MMHISSLFLNNPHNFKKLRVGSIIGTLTLVFIALLPRTLSPAVRISAIAYAFFIFWVLREWLWEKYEIIDNPNLSTPLSLFWPTIGAMAGLLLTVVTRLFLFARYGEAPLGYDTGFYLKYISSSNYAAYLSLGGSQGTPLPITLHWNPLFVWLRIPRDLILSIEYPLVQFLMAIGIWMILKRLFQGKSKAHIIASIGLILFSTSLVQFFGYWWMLFQQQLATAFLVVTIALFMERSPLAIITGMAGAAIHLPTLFMTGIALFLYCLIQLIRCSVRRERLDSLTRLVLFSATVMLFATFMTRTGFLSSNYALIHKFSQASFPAYQVNEAAGLFIDGELFRLSILFILPFSIVGILWAIRALFITLSKNMSSNLLLLLSFLSVLAGLTSIPIIYQHRFFLHLDLFLIIIAALPIVEFISIVSRDWLGKLLSVLLGLGIILNIGWIVAHQEPQIYQDELAEIRSTAQIAEPEAFLMVTESVYTPWVYTYSNHDTIAPGYLYWDRWNLNQWQEFWKGKSNARRHELLQSYKVPLYIFIGAHVDPNARYVQFIQHDSLFHKISDHFWRYDPRDVQTKDIDEMRRREQHPLPPQPL